MTGRSLLPLILLFLVSCSQSDVEQINVTVPQGIKVPEGMVYIPAGEFIMGDPKDSKTRGGKKVSLPAYFIDRYEVSRLSYRKFKPGSQDSGGREKFPVAHVDYSEAEAYCQWAGKRLPDEAEWEKAARGVDGRKWPWVQHQKHPNDGFSGFLPEEVDKRPEWISPYGVYGMGHNVWEWTRDWYAFNGMSAKDEKRFKVIRGGLTQTHLTIRFTPTWFRNRMQPGARFNFLGFRCAGQAPGGR